MSLPKLVELAIQLAIQEETKTQTQKETKEAPRTTKTQLIYTRQNLTLPATVFSDRGRGTIDELTIIASSDQISFTVFIDGKQLLNSSWSQLQQISKYVSWLGTVIDSGKYVLTITNINYSRSIEITAYGNATIENAVIKVTKEVKTR